MRNKVFHSVLIYLVCSLFSAALASFTDMGLGAGVISRFPGDIQTSQGGDTNGKSDFRPYLTLDINYAFYQGKIWDFSLRPEFSLETPGNTRDERISKVSYWLNLPFVTTYYFQAFRQESWVALRLGPGFSWTRISGDGGNATLPNGSGTANFPVPEGAVITQNIIVTAGLEYSPFKRGSIRFDAQSMNLTNSRNKTWSYLLSLHYHFGDDLWK